MKNLERTINGLTRHSARQLGQVYFTLAESLDMLDGLDKDRAAMSHEFTKLSVEACNLRHENAELKRKLGNMEDGGKMPEHKRNDSINAIFASAVRVGKITIPPMLFEFGTPVAFGAKAARVVGTMFKGDDRFYEIELFSGSHEIVHANQLAALDLSIAPEQKRSDDTPLPELDGHTPNEVREMQERAAQKVAQDYGDDQKPHKVAQALYPVRLAKLAEIAIGIDASTAATQQVSDAARDATEPIKATQP